MSQASSTRHDGRGRWIPVLLAALALVAQGCTAETPTEPEGSLEDALGGLQVLLTADSAGPEAAGSAFDGFQPAADGSLTEPTGGEIEVPFPGTPAVFSWPVVQDLPIHPSRQGGGSIHLSWPSVGTGTWPGYSDAGPSSDLHFGNAWMIYRVGNRWVAETVEWLREHERDGTVFHPHEKLTVGQPRNDEPVGFFIAGPSRHTPNREEYRRRTEPRWYRWGNLEEWVWEQEEPDPPPDPEPDPEPPVLEEVHVWISGLSTELADGTRLTFNEDVGDVDLLSLDGTTVEMADVQIPTGTYLHIAFNLDPERSYVIEGGAQKPLSIPEEDVRVEGPFDVNPSAQTSVTLHFDTEASLTQGDDGSWSLNPVVEIDITGG